MRLCGHDSFTGLSFRTAQWVKSTCMYPISTRLVCTVPWFTRFFAKVEYRLNCRDIYSETISLCEGEDMCTSFLCTKNGSFDDVITVGYSANSHAYIWSS